MTSLLDVFSKVEEAPVILLLAPACTAKSVGFQKASSKSFRVSIPMS